MTDPLNRQAQKEVDSTKTLFLHDDLQLIADYDDTPTLQNRYIPAAGLDEILIQISGSDTTFLHKDRLGSVIAQTDDTGAVLNKYVYAPFGRTPDLTGTIFGYTGQRYDVEIELYNYKERYYSPAVGRFMQPDPIGFGAGDLNLYTYVRNDSLNQTDPLGLMTIPGGLPGIAGPGGALGPFGPAEDLEPPPPGTKGPSPCSEKGTKGGLTLFNDENSEPTGSDKNEGDESSPKPPKDHEDEEDPEEAGKKRKKQSRKTDKEASSDVPKRLRFQEQQTPRNPEESTQDYARRLMEAQHGEDWASRDTAASELSKIFKNLNRRRS